MNTITTKSTESIIKEFSDYTLNNEIENIRQLLDINGEFEIQAKLNDTLYFSYIGYKSLKIVVTNDLIRFDDNTIELKNYRLFIFFQIY